MLHTENLHEYSYILSVKDPHLDLAMWTSRPVQTVPSQRKNSCDEKIPPIAAVSIYTEALREEQTVLAFQVQMYPY